MGSVVYDGQRPAPSRELAGDRDIGDGVALLAVDELDPAVVETTVALITPDSGGGGRNSRGLIPLARLLRAACG